MYLNSPGEVWILPTHTVDHLPLRRTIAIRLAERRNT
jgi:hypothetical protein